MRQGRLGRLCDSPCISTATVRWSGLTDGFVQMRIWLQNTQQCNCTIEVKGRNRDMSVLPVVTNLVYGMEVIDIASNVNSS